MQKRKWGQLVILSLGVLTLASCDSRHRNDFLTTGSGNTKATNSQQCIDKGYEVGSVQYSQCAEAARANNPD